MHLWPTYTSQNFYIPKGLESDDVDILDIISIQSINTFLVLTKERVLIYQGKPFAPILIYTRSKESLQQFGFNEKVVFNEPLNKVAGVNDSDVAIIDLNDSAIFYIKTDKSCLLILELETLQNWASNLTTYGVAPILDTENIINKIDFIEKVDLASNNKSKSFGNKIPGNQRTKRESIFFMEIDKNSKDNIDDDLLTVFDIKTNGRILQNGFINEKGKDLVQIMKEMFFIKSSFYRSKKNTRKNLINNNLIDNSNDKANQEEANNMVDDMPFKKCNIKLKTVLKFDNNVIDVQAFTKYDENYERQEIIYLLYKEELCVLTLKNDYTLDSKHKISGGNNQMMAFNGTDMFVINYDEDDNDAVVINRIDKKNNVIYTKNLMIPEFSRKKFKLIGISNFKERYLVLTFDKIIIYYDTFLNNIYSQIKLLKTTGILSELQRDQYIKVKTYDRELLTLLKENGNFQVYTRWGNLQTELNLSKLLGGKTSHDYKTFAYLDNYLLCGTNTGHLQVVDFYKDFKSNTFNERSNTDCSLFDSTTNKITTYFTSENKQEYFLPTNSINNIVSDIKYSGDKKYCLINIPNKNIILLKDFNAIDDDSDYDGWMVFDNMKILGMDWIGDRYVILDMIDLDNIHNGRSLVCLDINKIIKSKTYKNRVVHLLEMKIWAYNITNNDEILYWGCNTYDSMLEFRTKKKSEGDTEETLYKLGELNILLRKAEGNIFDTIDILIEKETLNVRSFARNIFDLSKLINVSISYEKDIKWTCHKKKGTLLILTGDDELHKVVEADNGSADYEIVSTKVEEVIDFHNGKITFVRANELLIYNFNELIENDLNKKEQVILQQSLMTFGNEYPLMIKSGLNDFASLSTDYYKYGDVINGYKMKLNTNVILDCLIKGLAKTNKFTASEVKKIFSKSEHYKFCLEKMITDISVEKVDQESDETTFKLDLLEQESLEDKLNIIVNCLRKVDLNQVASILKLLKYENLDFLIQDVDKVETVHTKAMLISKLMIVKFNTEGEIDEVLLDKGIRLLIEDIEKNKKKVEIEDDYNVIEEIGMFVEKLNGSKDVLLKLIDTPI